MSDLNKKLTEEYQKLCTVLGDLEYKMKILDEERQATVTKIKTLSSMFEQKPSGVINNEQNKK